MLQRTHTGFYLTLAETSTASVLLDVIRGRDEGVKKVLGTKKSDLRREAGDVVKLPTSALLRWQDGVKHGAVGREQWDVLSRKSEKDEDKKMNKYGRD